jgi:site-specific recombinase XerD
LYLSWVRFFIRWHALKHPRDMGAPEVEAFLSMLASDRKVSPSTHNQALSALLFLYREVLAIDLPWMNDIRHPAYHKRIPCALTKDEVVSVLARMEGTTALLARLLYGTGMRLMEAMRLRIKDVDFDRHAIIVREAWFWMFHSPTLSIHPRSGVERQHHLFEERLQRALKRAVIEAGHSFATHLLQAGVKEPEAAYA